MMRAMAVLAALLVVSSAANAQRLPATVVPQHYTLWFAPDLSARTFRGRDTILVRVAAPTTTITLNAAEISFGTVTVSSSGRSQTARVSTDASQERATFTVAQAIPAGTATIDITFTGVLNDKLRGFYLSKTAARNYAVTQLEATDARRAFPSFDEPALKATFDIALMIDRGDVAISNGRVTADRPGPQAGKHTVTFATTPKMSTYLVAMMVGDFACREGMADATPVRICATPDKRGLTDVALDAAVQSVKFFNRYFGIPYPFGKLDIIGIPDFSAGAMENAGAIAFRERALLVDPQHASAAVRRTVMEYTAHEVAHQWFGDLVTMKWWDDIWLNEGFATWMEKKAVEAIRPEWHMELAEAEDTQTALTLDSLQNTRAIHTAANTPEEINELFDAIAYQKTAAVMRMIEEYVGEEPFRQGVSSYLRKFSYGNANGEDFWTEMTRVTGKPVDRIMSGFVNQRGAPLLTVRSSCTAGASAMTLGQQRFVEAPSTAAPAGSASELWTFPACFKTNDAAPRCELVQRREQTATGTGCDNIFANADSRGYYMTEYAPDAVRALARSSPGLKPAERISLIGDEWRIVRAGHHGIDVFLDLAAAMSRDDTAAVIDPLAARLTLVGDALIADADRARYAAWIRERFRPALNRVGLPGSADDDDNRQGLRSTLLALVGVSGNDAEVQRQARQLAERYIADRRAVPPSLAAAVLQVAAVSGDRALYDQYLAQIQQLAAQPEEYYRFFNALPWFRDPALVQRTLELSLTPTVRSQDASVLLGGLMGSPWGREAAWTFTTMNWAALTQKLDPFQGIPDTVKGMGAFCSAARAQEMRAFFARNPVAASQRTVQQQIESVERCGALKARTSEMISRWLAAQPTQPGN